MIKLTTILKDTQLYEGLIYSVSSDTFTDHVERWTISKDKTEVKILNSGKIKLEIIQNLNEKDLKNLLTWINNLGWKISTFISHSEVNPKWSKFDLNNFLKSYSNNNVGVIFSIEPKFDVERSREEFKGDFYHVSPTKNDKKIFKIGLVPKAKEKISSHPERVYLTNRIEDAIALADTFSSIEKEHQYTIYKVNMELAKKRNEGIRLFSDPTLFTGVYTLSNTPPQFLSVIKRIEV